MERERIYESEPSGSLELCHGGGAAADRLRQNERRVGQLRQHERKQRHILRTDPDSGMENRSGCGDRGHRSGDRAGKIELAAAAVLLDGEGKLESVLLDELEVSVSADSTGHVTLPTDWRTKRQKGDDYPLAEVSSLKKGWAEQADAFASYLIGMTPEQVSMLKVDKDGKPTDADLLSGCTIAVDRYRDAVTRACANARTLGAAKGDRVALGIEAVNGTSDITATDDKDVNAQVDVSIVALTTDTDRRVTSAIADMAEPALTVVSDGGVTAPDLVKTKLELGEDYGMRGASALGKEWYEHSEGFCDALKGKTRTEIAGLSGGDADLKALCTIDITDLQKAALDALS